MVPALVETAPNGNDLAHGRSKTSNGHTNTKIKLPLEANGSLDSYNFNDLTPCIGREFPTANLVDMMSASNSDELLQELALTSMALRSSSNYPSTDCV